MSANNQDKLTLLSLRWPRRGFSLALVVVLAMGLGAALDRSLLFNGIPLDARDDFRLMAQAWNLIDNYYVDRPAIRHTAMTHAAISAMLDSLGDTNHSAFLNPTQSKRAGTAMQGKLIGIGIEIQSKNHQAVVVAPIDGSPAQQAGVRAGDVILQVNGRPVSGLSLGQISSRISGEAGQPVALTVINPRDKRTRQLTIARASIKLNNVSWQRLPGTDIAHVRIALFSDGEAGDLRKALLELERQGAHKIILDIRNNPGGALDEAIGTASQFLASGTVLWEKDSAGKLTPVPVQAGGAATNLPMVVLINGGSASDSEIVAGALHDTGRAALIGETTYGTGTVLSEFQMADGSTLLLAVEEWLTPDKHSFWHRGIAPDIRVTQPPETPILRPTLERQLTGAELRSSGDAQLLRAIAWLADKEARH
ncbi:MAG: S41 family peptidase [Limisphaerales bacterium]